MLEYTGERYIPWMEIGEIHYEHIHRYYFASKISEKKKVLDMASGEGYGSYILSEHAHQVIGIDKDEQCIKHASIKYRKENMRFINGSITEIPIKGEKIFDIIVCFEAIEHIKEQKKLLSEVRRLLKDNGLFIVSTPNKQFYSDEEKFQNPFHLEELYFDEFKDLLSLFFKNIVFFAQRLFISSNVWQLYRGDNNEYDEFIIELKKDHEYSLSDRSKKVPKFYIAVASNSPIDKNIGVNSSLIDCDNLLYNKKDKLITDYTNFLREKEDTLIIYHDLIEQKGRLIEQQEQQIRQQEQQIRQQEQQIRQQEQQIRQQEQQIRSQQEFIDLVKNSLAYKIYKKTYKPFKNVRKKLF